MKSSSYKVVAACFLLFSIFACKKYGYVFDDGWDLGSDDSTGISVDTSGFEIDKSMYNKARIFPGLVDTNERRIQDTTILFDLNYTKQSGFIAVPLPIFSTGLYAGPGELVQITVPQGINGLTVQVGIHSDDLTSLNPRKREPLIVSSIKLFPGVNSVRNPFGGYIWIKSALPLSQPTPLQFKGAVKAPDFVLGVSDVQSWKKQVIASGTPWLELRTTHMVFSVSRELALRGINDGSLDQIDQTMKEWDKVITEDFYSFNGLVENSTDPNIRMPDLPERGVMDIQLTDGIYAHTGGQPLYVLSDQYWFDEWTNINTLRQGRSVGTYTQLGINYQPAQTPWWTGFETTTSTFQIYKTASRNGVIPDILEENGVRDMFPLALAYAARDSGKYLDGDIEGAAFPMFKLTPFIQIFEKVTNPQTGQDGWGFNGYLINKARNSPSLGTDDMSKRSFVYTSLCEYAQRDFASFFDFWGIPIGDHYRDQMSTTYPPLDVALWEYDPITRQGGDRHYVASRAYHVRTDWTIVASSEATNEGDLNRIPALIDGDPTTYWHSCYNCNPATLPPHILTFDMHKVNTVNGFFIAARRGQTHPRSVEISISGNRETWESLGTFPLQDRNNNQYLTLSQAKSFQYVRLTFNENNYGNATYVAIAEFGTFYNK